MFIVKLFGQRFREEAPDGGDPGATTTPPADPPADPGRPSLAATPPAAKASPGFDYNPEAFGDPDPETGRPANLPEKYWNKETKTINASAILERHNSLESKLGSFAGAPESYEMPKELFPEGSGVTPDEELIGKFSEIAKKHNMSQELYNELMGLQVGSQLAALQNQPNPEQYRAAELAKLGDDGERQIGIMTTAFENSISELPSAEREALMKGYAEAVVSAPTAKFVRHLMNAAKTVQLPNFNTHTTGTTKADIEVMNAKIDEKTGRRLVEVDPAYRKVVDQAFKDFYGEGPARQIVG